MTEPNIVGLAADIISAYVHKNSVHPADLPGLIADVHGTLLRISTGVETVVAEEQKPAVPIKKSVFPDFIVCLENGKKFKSLKRHLLTTFDLTPEQYRKKWGLAGDYPMVAPNYAARRSALALSMGLGQKRKVKSTAGSTKQPRKSTRKSAKGVAAETSSPGE